MARRKGLGRPSEELPAAIRQYYPAVTHRYIVENYWPEQYQGGRLRCCDEEGPEHILAARDIRDKARQYEASIRFNALMDRLYRDAGASVRKVPPPPDYTAFKREREGLYPAFARACAKAEAFLRELPADALR